MVSSVMVLAERAGLGAGQPSGLVGDYDQDRWYPADWWWAHRPDYARQNHPDWWGDFDDHHVWHNDSWWHQNNPTWMTQHHPEWQGDNDDHHQWRDLNWWPARQPQVAVARHPE